MSNLTVQSNPPSANTWSSEVNSFMAIDESGTSELKSIERMISNSDQNNIDKWFILTGVIFNKDAMEFLPQKITEFKEKYWSCGEYCGKRVVLHSKEMRHRENAFSKRCIPDYDSFIGDLCDLLGSLPFKLVSIVVDKYKHVLINQERGTCPYGVYEYALALLLERYTFNMGSQSAGALLFESRNGGADRKLYSKALNTVKNGTYYVSGANFNFLRERIYFNSKRTADNKKSYFMLELADLFSYAVLQHFRKNEDSKIYTTMSKKLVGYPDFDGKGLKVLY